MSKDGLIIVTGGAGFIGSCFVAKLNQEGWHNILVVDHLGQTDKWQNLNNKSFIDYLEKDTFLNYVEEGRTPGNIKAIFHLGACSSTTETDASYLLKNNYQYSKTLAAWALKEHIPFYYASSAATYGDGALGYSDSHETTHRFKPLNMYGFSKHLFDLWLIRNKLIDKVVGFKYFNVYGPNEYHKGEMRSLVDKAYQQIKKDKKIRLFKSYLSQYKHGEQKRDFIYVKDAVNLMYQIWQQGDIKGLYNLGTGQAQTWNDLAKAIFSALKMKPKIEYIEMPDSIKDKYQYFTQADLTKLKNKLPDFEFTPLEAAVADYVNNYLEQNQATF